MRLGEPIAAYIEQMIVETLQRGIADTADIPFFDQPTGVAGEVGADEGFTTCSACLRRKIQHHQVFAQHLDLIGFRQPIESLDVFNRGLEAENGLAGGARRHFQLVVEDRLAGGRAEGHLEHFRYRPRLHGPDFVPEPLRVLGELVGRLIEVGPDDFLEVAAVGKLPQRFHRGILVFVPDRLETGRHRRIESALNRRR